MPAGSEPSTVENSIRPEDRLSASGYDSPKNPVYKSRHISLQSRVDSIAEETTYGHLMADNLSLPDLPATHKQSRPHSYLLETSFPTCNDVEALGPPQSPNPHYEQTSSEQRVHMSTLQEVFFVAVVAVSHFMTQAGLGQALAPLDIIATSFDTHRPGEASWFIAGYSLSVGTFILISGRLGDILGHKRIFVFGYAWFGVWAAFAGFSAYPGRQIYFDFCRAMQGIGPALVMPNGLALFGRAYAPGMKKNIVFSIFGAVAPAGFVTGATFGSLFAQLAWWPWGFWGFALACWVLATIALIVVPRDLSSPPAIAPNFDWTGSIIGVTGLILVNVAWNNGPLFGWATPHVYFVLIIGLLCVAFFIWIERRAANPILPIDAMTGIVNFVLVCVGLGWGAFGIWVFYLFRFLATIRHLTPLTASAQFAPAVPCGLISAAMTGLLLSHTPVSFVMFISMCAFCIGIVVAATQPAQQSYWIQTFMSVLIMPFGMDSSFPAASIILSNHMPAEHQGLAMSLVNTVVNYSISIALGIAGTVEMSAVKDVDSEVAKLKGLRSAFYSAIGLSLMGVVCGAAFSVRTIMRDGWKVMNH